MLNRNVQITTVENDFTREEKRKPLRMAKSSVSSEAKPAVFLFQEAEKEAPEMKVL